MGSMAAGLWPIREYRVFDVAKGEQLLRWQRQGTDTGTRTESEGWNPTALFTHDNVLYHAQYRTVGFFRRSMPVSGDQIVAAFSIMGCMTLKRRATVSGDRLWAVQAFEPVPPRPRRQPRARTSPQAHPEYRPECFLPASRTLLDTVMRPVVVAASTLDRKMNFFVGNNAEC